MTATLVCSCGREIYCVTTQDPFCDGNHIELERHRIVCDGAAQWITNSTSATLGGHRD